MLGAGLGAAVGRGPDAAVGAATGAPIGTGLGSSGGAWAQMTVQQRYNIAYMPCMYANDSQVPGYTAVAPVPPATATASAILVRLSRLGSSD